MPFASSLRSGYAVRGLPSLGLFGFLVGVSTLTTQASYAVIDLFVLCVIYASMAHALSCFARLLARRGLGLELAGALIIGFVLAWHLREQLRPAGVGATLWTVAGMAPFLVSALIAAGAQFLLGRLPQRAPRAGSRLLPAFGASSVVFVAVLVVSFGSSESLRWHLLRHNKLIGTPAFHVLGLSVPDLEEQDWASHANGPIIQPEWVLARRPDSEFKPVSATPFTSATDGARLVEHSPQPDVVFVLVDTLRADTLSAYGGDPSLMPALNAITDTAVVFSDVLANSSWTRPSVASFFTGLAPEEHGAVGWSYPISPGVVTMAEVFKRRGYETAAFVANHEAINIKGNFDRGFDTFEPLEEPGRSYARADLVTDRVSEWIASREPPGSGVSVRPLSRSPRPLFE